MDKPPTKRASRFVRPKQPPRMVLTKRDKNIIRAVNDFRVLKQDQVERLFFPSKSTAQVRLQRLWQHGFLKRDVLPVATTSAMTMQMLYAIDKTGAALLESEFDYTEEQLRLSSKAHFDQRFLAHTLGLADVRIAVQSACQTLGYQLRRWSDEKTMKADYDRVAVKNRLIAVLPDAYFVVRLPTGVDLQFFVEYDTGSERLKFLAQKLHAYWVYFQTNKCETRYGTNRIRVLTIVEGTNSPTQKRVNNLVKLTRSLESVSWFWFATGNVLGGNILTDNVWLRPDRDTPLALVLPSPKQ